MQWGDLWFELKQSDTNVSKMAKSNVEKINIHDKKLNSAANFYW